MRGLCLVFIIVSMVLAATFVPLHAAWLPEGNAVCTATDVQTNTLIVEDGAGGTIIIWEDDRYGNTDIFAQRIDRLGNILWAEYGVPVIQIAGTQNSFDAVEDGSGGVIITWQDFRSGINYDIYCQRLDNNGNQLWHPLGSSICSAADDQRVPRITTDGAGGAIVAWSDTRNGSYDIYARRIDSGGTPLWTVWGEPVCTYLNVQMDIAIATDGDGGAYIAWEDLRNGNNDIYMQWLSSDGSIQVTTDGIAVCDDAAYQYDPEIINVGYHLVVFAWIDYRTSPGQAVYAQLYSNGLWQWIGGERQVVETPTGILTYFDFALDSGYRLVFSWSDYRNGSSDIFAQCVNLDGIKQWAADGVVVCDAYGTQDRPRIFAGNEGGTIIAWRDQRGIVTEHVYTQKLDSDGNSLWESNGKKVCGESTLEEDFDIISDGQGGAVFAWTDYRNDLLPSDLDIFAQRIERNGYAGYPAPSIHAVDDVPDDEGGKVNLAWYASYLDPWPYQEITHYTIWKSIDPAAAAQIIEGDTKVFESIVEFSMYERETGLTLSAAVEQSAPEPIPDLDTAVPVIRIETAAGSTHFWELIDSQTAQYYEQYSKVVSTDFDSQPTAFIYRYFQVAAHTADPLVVWTSEPDSGYSVDNLSPAVPLALAGEQVYTPEGLQLTWDENTEPDLGGYLIYRGESSDFVPNTATIIATVPGAAFLDEGWDWEPGYWYKVAAVDIHDNVSGFAILGPAELTGDDPMPLPDATFLAQNYPNPFNPNTTIAFGLKTGGFVNLSIYNASGQLVAVLINESRPAGQYATVWNGKVENESSAASGVYFYKLTAKEFEETKKMILLR